MDNPDSSPMKLPGGDCIPLLKPLLFSVFLSWVLITSVIVRPKGSRSGIVLLLVAQVPTLFSVASQHCHSFSISLFVNEPSLNFILIWACHVETLQDTHFRDAG